MTEQTTTADVTTDVMAEILPPPTLGEQVEVTEPAFLTNAHQALGGALLPGLPVLNVRPRVLDVTELGQVFEKAHGRLSRYLDARGSEGFVEEGMAKFFRDADARGINRENLLPREVTGKEEQLRAQWKAEARQAAWEFQQLAQELVALTTLSAAASLEPRTWSGSLPASASAQERATARMVDALEYLEARQRLKEEPLSRLVQEYISTDDQTGNRYLAKLLEAGEGGRLEGPEDVQMYERFLKARAAQWSHRLPADVRHARDLYRQRTSWLLWDQVEALLQGR